MKEELIVKAAIEEIVNPKFAVTKQYLSVHKVPYKNGRPIISRVDKDAGDGGVIVYFPIEGEYYFLAVIVDTEPEVSVRWVWIEPGNRVYLVVVSKELELEELIRFSGIEPTTTWKRGEALNKMRKHDDNGFDFEPNPERADELEDKVEKLLNILESVKEKIINLSEKSELQINIAYYGYKEEMWGWHLDLKTIQRLALLNIEVDLDLYAGGPDLPFEI